MPIQIKLAGNASEVDALFKLRHRIFVEEMGVIAAEPDGRLYDRYDAYASTSNIIALDRRRVIGAIRLTRWSVAGLPAEDFFDFTPHVPALHLSGCASMFCVEPEYRGQSNLASLLVETMSRHAAALGLSHVVVAINPAIERFLMRMGFQPLGAAARDPKTQLPFIPMRLALAESQGRLRDLTPKPEARRRATRIEAKTEQLRGRAKRRLLIKRQHQSL